MADIKADVKRLQIDSQIPDRNEIISQTLQSSSLLSAIDDFCSRSNEMKTKPINISVFGSQRTGKDLKFNCKRRCCNLLTLS